MYKLTHYLQDRFKKKWREKLLRTIPLIVVIFCIILTFTAINQLSVGSFEQIPEEIMLKEGFKTYYFFAKRMMSLLLFFFAFIIYIVFRLTDKGNKNQKKRNLMTFYSYGYSIKKIRLTLLIENLITLFFSIIMAILLTWISYEFYFKKTSMSFLFKKITISNNIESLLILGLLTSFLFVISSIVSFNHKKINRFFSS